MFTITSAQDVKFENGVPYIIGVSGGTLQVQRYKTDGTKEDVPVTSPATNPIADGAEWELITESAPKADGTGTFLHLIPSTTAQVTFRKIEWSR